MIKQPFTDGQSSCELTPSYISTHVTHSYLEDKRHPPPHARGQAGPGTPALFLQQCFRSQKHRSAQPPARSKERWLY